MILKIAEFLNISSQFILFERVDKTLINASLKASGGGRRGGGLSDNFFPPFSDPFLLFWNGF